MILDYGTDDIDYLLFDCASCKSTVEKYEQLSDFDKDIKNKICL